MLLSFLYTHSWQCCIEQTLEFDIAHTHQMQITRLCSNILSKIIAYKSAWNCFFRHCFGKRSYSFLFRFFSFLQAITNCLFGLKNKQMSRFENETSLFQAAHRSNDAEIFDAFPFGVQMNIICSHKYSNHMNCLLFSLKFSIFSLNFP